LTTPDCSAKLDLDSATNPSLCEPPSSTGFFVDRCRHSWAHLCFLLDALDVFRAVFNISPQLQDGEDACLFAPF
jgi:hypothetical protein